ncbi:MAG: PspA/IM30 family protein [Planctomycetes bacterium]|nr:PspA/IM30 family protein [Planctomycetota bacterium]
MGLFDRIAELITSNLQDLLGESEDPADAVAGVLREIEERIDQTRGHLAQAISNERRIRALADQARSRVEACGREASEAVARGEDDRARAALARKKAPAEDLDELQGQGETARRYRDAIEEKLRALEAKQSEARRHQERILERIRVAQEGRALSAAARPEDTREVDRVLARTARQTEALGEGAPPPRAAASAEFQDLALDEAVERELQDLKRRLGR